ncbi:unnamed protein product [Menidia menidia]|uniref:(Atlantic silverside) hypothetical protein n=1 Tax=Menidia menidia TaxID=238744 RepID=A0A8S4AZN1_9TELE|nr:unnamed protein product [Menidia menidia]
MLGRIFFACLLLLLGLCGSGSSLSCRWMDHKFRQYSEQSLDLIEMMVSVLICALNGWLTPTLTLVNNQPVLCVMQGNNSTNSTEDEEEENRAAFPLHLYSQASKASNGICISGLFKPTGGAIVHYFLGPWKCEEASEAS